MQERRKNEPSTAQLVAVEQLLDSLKPGGDQPTGDDARAHAFGHCTRCAVGQGRLCDCEAPLSVSRLGIRLVILGFVIVWCLVPVIAPRGCSA